jgi:hypothetical protein
MPNQFNGQVYDTNGRVLEGVKVSLTVSNTSTYKTATTNSEGKWLITLDTSVDPKNVNITFSKSGLESKIVKNPQQTEILNGYIDPEKGGTLDLAGQYDSGKWKVTSLTSEQQLVIDKEIQDLYTFAKNNPGNFKITIEASESRVPNNDNEEGKTKQNEFRTTPGSLAKARALNLQEYVVKKINELYSKETNKNFTKPSVILGKIDAVGGAEWKAGNNPDAEGYKSYQFTRLKADFITKPKCEFITSTTDANIRAGGFVTFKSIGESYIEFDPAVAPDLFIIESSRDGVIKRTQSPTFYQTPDAPGNPISYGIVAFITNNTNKDIKINLENTKAIQIAEAVDILMNDYNTILSFRNDVDKILAKYEFVGGDTRTRLNNYLKKDGGYQTYYYVIKKEYYKFDFITNNIKTGDEFKVKAVSGAFDGGSNYNYRMCK